MPIYEYECRDCGHVFDALQKMSDQPLVDCPACGKAGLRKLLSAPNFRLKGGGWYETDFKNNNKRNLADGGKASGSGEGEKAGKDTTAADKPADKPQAAVEKPAVSGSGAPAAD